MNLPRLYTTTLAAAALAAMGVFAVNVAAQNPTGTPPDANSASATADNLPAWAYPPTPAGRGAGGGRGRGQAQGGGTSAGTPSGVPGAAPGGAPTGSPAAAPAPAAVPAPVMHIPGSDAAYTQAQVRNMHDVPDWFPGGHPPMPDIISHGDKVLGGGGCGYCHLPNGYGRTENQSIAGLPAQYIIDQVADFKSGVRKTSGPRLSPVATMVRESQTVSDDQVKIAAEYFASIKPTRWIRVVETDTVPKTKVAGPIWVVADGGGTEPIGERIVELAEDQDRFELRDASSGFVAYVPTGSIAKGKEIVTSGAGGKTTPCTICHGADLKGIGNIPSIAGRSPSEMARQIVDIQNSNRNGAQAALMKPVVAKLTNEDIVNITAYLVSLAP
jgi:cytochrome c553